VFESVLTESGKPQRIHVVGVGGAGMSAIAEVLVAMGHVVSGSDAKQSPVLDRLKDKDIDVWSGHIVDRISSDLDLITTSTAVPRTDVELAKGAEIGVPILSRSEMLAAIARTRKPLAVAGTHGKTTTSSFLALGLQAAGADPSWIIGGDLAGRGNGSCWSDGDLFVVEADESDGTFLHLGAHGAIVTNIERDHLEHYGGWQQLQDAFTQFVQATRGPAILCADDPVARSVAESVGCITYGQFASAHYRVEDVSLGAFDATFKLHHGDESVEVRLATTGLHNVLNSAAALAMIDSLGYSMEDAVHGIAGFSGVGRRFEFRGSKSGTTFVDDYAHLPSEVKAALDAARAGNWDRVVTVFQPHRYSRTEEVGHEFGGSFDATDELILTDVFAAGEQPRPGIDGRVVLRAIQSSDSAPNVTYVPDRQAVATEVAKILRPGDLCLTLGAGDVTFLPDEIQDQME
jgi:UDP-N-acetylmuramate--alanine ligase